MLTARKAARATQFSGSATVSVPTGGIKKKLKQTSAAIDVRAAAQNRLVAATSSTTRRKVSATVAPLLTANTRVNNTVTSPTPLRPASARTQSRMTLHRMTGLTPQPIDSFLPAIAAQFIFESRQRRSHDVAMMQIRSDVFHGVHPQVMDPLDVGARQIRHMRAERV